MEEFIKEVSKQSLFGRCNGEDLESAESERKERERKHKKLEKKRKEDIKKAQEEERRREKEYCEFALQERAKSRLSAISLNQKHRSPSLGRGMKMKQIVEGTSPVRGRGRLSNEELTDDSIFLREQSIRNQIDHWSDGVYYNNNLQVEIWQGNQPGSPYRTSPAVLIEQPSPKSSTTDSEQFDEATAGSYSPHSQSSYHSALNSPLVAATTSAPVTRTPTKTRCNRLAANFTNPPVEDEDEEEDKQISVETKLDMLAITTLPPARNKFRAGGMSINDLSPRNRIIKPVLIKPHYYSSVTTTDQSNGFILDNREFPQLK